MLYLDFNPPVTFSEICFILNLSVTFESSLRQDTRLYLNSAPTKACVGSSPGGTQGRALGGWWQKAVWWGSCFHSLPKHSLGCFWKHLWGIWLFLPKRRRQWIVFTSESLKQGYSYTDSSDVLTNFKPIVNPSSASLHPEEMPENPGCYFSCGFGSHCCQRIFSA